MFKSKGTASGTQGDLVWLLGNRHPSADRSIRWDDPFPNLSDPDVLIVDLTTLDEATLRRVDKAKLKQARGFIRDKLLSRGIVIVITKPTLSISLNDAASTSTLSAETPAIGTRSKHSNYDMLPASLITRIVPGGDTIVADDEHDFATYIKNIKGFSFYIEKFHSRFDMKTREEFEVALDHDEEHVITDNSGHALGGVFAVAKFGYRGDVVARLETSGRLIFLPPPTEAIGEAIGKILSVYGKTSYNDPPPPWVENLLFGPLPRLNKDIAGLEEEKNALEVKIDALTFRRNEISKHWRLLYSVGSDLETAVVDAFRVLGFDDATHSGKGDSEDVTFGIKNDRYLYGVIEVKGADKRTGLEDLLQCNKWTDKRLKADGKQSKGIFVPNQYRLDEYPASRTCRKKFEPNELEYAENKDICIIPSYVLFEAVKRALEGNLPDRLAIAKKMVATRGVLEDVHGTRPGI